MVSWLFRQLGGPFTHEPDQLYNKEKDEFHESLSSGARRLIEKAFEDIDVSKMVDYHTHIIGLREQGCRLDERMLSFCRGGYQYIKGRIFMAASGLESVADNPDQKYVRRLSSLIENSAPGKITPQGVHGKYCILALSKVFSKEGVCQDDETSVYIPNDYIHYLAQQHPRKFIATCSVHPKNPEALEELDRCHKNGARLIKWLPNVMNIDPASDDEDYRRFYEKVRELDMFLLIHTGGEHSISSRFHDDSLGNPLKLKGPLDCGVKVIAAHCGSEGYSKNEEGQLEDNFQLFIKMMKEQKYESLLFGDLSAMTSFRRVKYLKEVLQKEWLHDRLVNGSDYPVCAINVIVHTRRFVSLGLISEEERHQLNEIYYFNPLLFDFVCKRTIRFDGKKLPPEIFMERPSLKVIVKFETLIN
ncbi:uncharacterized protein [Oscarella lobularis]|uniref:uncharacterized protein n=1 Tax=Oscarella lobularis TaxID=121494 RepID=UPI003313188C